MTFSLCTPLPGIDIIIVLYFFNKSDSNGDWVDLFDIHNAGRRQHGLSSKMDSIRFHNYTLAVLKHNYSAWFPGRRFRKLKQRNNIRPSLLKTLYRTGRRDRNKNLKPRILFENVSLISYSTSKPSLVTYD